MADSSTVSSKMFHEHVKENTEAHTELLQGLRDITLELERHGKEEAKVHKHLFGNGKAGLDEEVRALMRFADNAKRIIWILVTGMLVGAGSLTWAATVWFLRNGQ